MSLAITCGRSKAAPGYRTAQKNMFNNLLIHRLERPNHVRLQIMDKATPSVAPHVPEGGSAREAPFTLADSVPRLCGCAANRQKFVLTVGPDRIPIHVVQRLEGCRHGFSDRLDGA